MKKPAPGLLLLLILITACAEKGEDPPGAVSTGAEVNPIYADLAWPALALLKTGENPLWFELGPEGPSLIESPAAATLLPYTPWPHARFIAGMRLWEDFLVMAVNRDGFLVLGLAEETTDLILYRAADSALWGPYTTESFFIWEDKPAVLLYRNDFFSDPSVPPPSSQVYILDRSCSVPLSASVPALENVPAHWEAEVLRRGPDGFWYYRIKEKGQEENETAYFRTGDLTQRGEEISAVEWRDSGHPESQEKVSFQLTAVLNRAAELAPVPAVRAVSPDFEGQRFFSSTAGSENLTLWYAYCGETPEPLALAVLPDGRGLYSLGTEAAAKPFSLPALPEGFVYNGIALVGNVLAASWEEQQDAGIGAAGFMLIAWHAKIR